MVIVFDYGHEGTAAPHRSALFYLLGKDQNAVLERLELLGATGLAGPAGGLAKGHDGGALPVSIAHIRGALRMAEC